jgi:2-hydroxychromene-2-carboxylate isomerase
MTKQKELIFYFDYISPYSFLAWRKIGELTNRYNLNLKPVPVLFGAILSHWDTRGPAEIEPKREYTYKDIVRSAARDKIKLQFPPAHPFNPLLALRATCIMENHPKYYFSFITSLFEACWIQSRDLANEEFILDILNLHGIRNGSELLKSEPVKKSLKDKTEEAVLRGVFGVPAMIADSELFWGNDRLEFLENYLKGEDPVSPAQLKHLINLPRGIDRKQKDIKVRI